MCDYKDRIIENLNKRLLEAYTDIGSLTCVMDTAIYDLKTGRSQRALKWLEINLSAYNAKRDANLVRLGLPPRTRPVPTMVREKDLDYDLKHGE